MYVEIQINIKRHMLDFKQALKLVQLVHVKHRADKKNAPNHMILHAPHINTQVTVCWSLLRIYPQLCSSLSTITTRLRPLKPAGESENKL